MRTRILALIWGVLGSIGVIAQDNIGKFTNYNINNGLSQSTVTHIFQDKKGFIWLGTSDGLNRFDGKKFIVFKNKHANKNSLSDSWILRILKEDSENNLWILTSDRAINKFNLQTGVIKRFIPNDADTGALPSLKQIFSLVEDTLKNMWITTNAGVFRISHQDNLIKRYCTGLPADSHSKDMRIWAYKDYKGIIWFGSASGVCKYDYHSDKFIKYSLNRPGLKGIPPETAITFMMDEGNQLWILTYNGICKFDDEKDSFFYYLYPDKLRSEGDYKVTSVLSDK
jgi:ligand-binding sensor domain-containing protein